MVKMENILYDELKKLKEKENRLEPKMIYLDEKDGKIKEEPLSKLNDSTGAYMKKRKSELDEIHDFMFS